MKYQDAQKLLEGVKTDLLTCESSMSGWKQIESDLKDLNLTKQEADRIIVSVGKHLSARIKSGETLDSLLDNLQNTLDSASMQVMALPAPAVEKFADITGSAILPPPLPPAVVRSAIKNNAPLGALVIKPPTKVSAQEKKETQGDLQSTLQNVIATDPRFLARGLAVSGGKPNRKDPNGPKTTA